MGGKKCNTYFFENCQEKIRLFSRKKYRVERNFCRGSTQLREIRRFTTFSGVEARKLFRLRRFVLKKGSIPIYKAVSKIPTICNTWNYFFGRMLHIYYVASYIIVYLLCHPHRHLMFLYSDGNTVQTGTQ